MSREGSSNTENIDDIPLARRFKPPIGFRSPKIRYLLYGLFSLTFISSFITIRSNSLQKLSYLARERVLNSQISKDGLLLGHYPYPEASHGELVSVYPGLKVHKDTFESISLLRQAAAKEGIQLVLLSGFRSIDLQRRIFYENKSFRNQIAIERAKVSAPPGYSEHSTGYAIDFGDGNMRHTDFEVDFERTPAFKWLKKNAPRFHFVLSFPKGNSQGVSYEPWHWRFEGTVEALRQFERANQRMRLDRKNQSNGLTFKRYTY